MANTYASLFKAVNANKPVAQAQAAEANSKQPAPDAGHGLFNVSSSPEQLTGTDATVACLNKFTKLKTTAVNINGKFPSDRLRTFINDLEYTHQETLRTPAKVEQELKASKQTIGAALPKSSL